MNIDISIRAARAELEAAQADLVEALSNDKSRSRGPLVRRLHEVRRMLMADYRFTSQAGQDVVVDRLFKGKRNGTFVDVGGYDGVTGSNTLYLEVFRGWTGILVEPVPAQLERAKQVRRCPCLGVAVATGTGEAEFIEVRSGLNQMSGLSASYDENLLSQVRADPRHKEVVHKIETRSLPDILDELGTPNPDFLSLDIEGGEMDVLSSFPFDTYRPRIWSIENNTGSSALSELMKSAGYGLVEFCGPDDVYLDRQAS